ncbi:MAG: ABC transporter permease [Anaerolineaceae bacterium]|nr:ABC transporter permease [Anaerolineaceae bacterium]
MTPLKDLWKKCSSSKLFWPILSLLLIMLFNLLVNPSFFNIEMKEGHLYGSLIDVLNRGTPLMLLAIGMTLVLATGGVDLSVGPVIAITGAVAAYLIGSDIGVTHTPFFLVILTAIGAALLAGLWNGILVSRAGIQPIIATLILLGAGRGLAQMITQGQILNVYYKPFDFIGAGFLLLPFPVYIVTIVVILVWLLTRKTAVGLFIESIGINTSSSFYSGISEKNIKLLVYVISGLCAGIAGLILASNIRSADANNVGLFIEMDAILAAVIGGTSLAGGRFSLAGSILGALIIQSLTTTILSVGVPPQVISLIKALVVLAVSLLQSPDFRNIVFGRLVKKGALS